MAKHQCSRDVYKRQTLKQEIFGKDIAINQIMDILKIPKQKGTSFLLVGGSGVGKTETVKIVSKVLKMELIRLDMSEYATPESIDVYKRQKYNFICSVGIKLCI